MNPTYKNRTKVYGIRTGISLFEVLVAILVAAIGVTGVLVLIPFAVKNSQQGIDRESAITAAKNFYADFQAYGYHDPNTWYDNNPPPMPHIPSIGVPPNPPSNNIINGWPYVFDPIGITDTMFAPTPPAPAPSPDASRDFGNFCANLQYSNGNAPADLPLLNNITIEGFLVGANNQDRARNHKAFMGRLCLPQDLLIFDQPQEELGKPQQRYFELDSQTGAKRQSRTKYGIIAFLVPTNDAPRTLDDGVNEKVATYKMYTLVLSVGDRTTARVFELPLPPITPSSSSPRGFQGIALGGGDANLTELTVQPSDDVDIRNNDWMMLINYYNPGSGPIYDDVQLNFYRVIHAVKSPIPPPLATPTNRFVFDVTLTGPDFDLIPDWDDIIANNGAVSVKTYAVLIPNVLAVYERTFRAEQNSTWVQQ